MLASRQIQPLLEPGGVTLQLSEVLPRIVMGGIASMLPRGQPRDDGDQDEYG